MPHPQAPLRPRSGQAGAFRSGAGEDPMETKALLDSLDMGVVAVAPDWTIAEWSAGAARITGLPAERALRGGFWIACSGGQGPDREQGRRAARGDGAAR